MDKERILKATLDVYKEKGIKFRMDDIAKELSISKKTIYVIFKDKKALINEMVDYCFDSIKECEKEVIEDCSLSTIDKIKKILGVMPSTYADIDLTQLYVLKEKYPLTYKKVEARLESGWEVTMKLLEQGQEEGVIRNVSLPLFKSIFEASLEQFFKRDVLVRSHLTYNEALMEIVSILVEGIRVKEND